MDVYKEMQEASKINLTSNELKTPQVSVTEEFDARLSNFFTFLLNQQLENFNEAANALIEMINNENDTLMEHIVSTNLLANSLDYFINNDDVFLPSILKVFSALCKKSKYLISQELIMVDNFSSKMSALINTTEEPSIFGYALILTGNIYHDSFKKGFTMTFNIDLNVDVFERVTTDFVNMEETALSVYAKMLEGNDDEMMRNNLLLYATAIIPQKPMFDISKILNSFIEHAKCDKESIEILENNQFLYDKLISIVNVDDIATVETNEETKNMLYNNAIKGLELVITINKTVPEIGTKLLLCFNWAVVRGIKDKPDKFIECIFMLLSSALPTRSWLMRQIKESEVLDHVIEILAESKFNVRAATLSFIDTLLQYTINLEYLDNIVCDDLVYILIDFLETTEWEFLFLAVKTIFHLSDVILKMERGPLLCLFKCEEVGNAFDEIELNSDIPKKIHERMLSFISDIKERVDDMLDE